MSDKLRVGIIGLGFIGTQKHLENLAQHKDRAEIVAFCDYEIDRAEKALQIGRASCRERV